MPIHVDILENRVLGREYKRGFEEGMRQAKREAEHKGEVRLLRRQLQYRFGAVPEWAEERLTAMPTDDLVGLGVRLVDATSLEELLR